MAIKCLFGKHSWDGCKCTKCSKVRNEEHNWDGCKCTKCGEVRNEEHNWNGCKCAKCESIRDEQHNWNGCTCSVCGKIRDEQHDMADGFCKICGFGTFKDERDGKVYKTIKIGDQEWLAENFSYKPEKGKYWAYDKDESNVAKYGYLYDLESALSACPIGWHLPEKSEFEVLLNNTGGSAQEAFKSLIAEGGSGFSALFGGYYTYYTKIFFHEDNIVVFPSSTEDKVNGMMWTLFINNSQRKAILVNYSLSRFDGASVRYLRD